MEWIFVSSTTICHLSPLCHSFIATLQLGLLDYYNSPRKCWNKLVVCNFYHSSRSWKYQDFFVKINTFISRPRPFFMCSRHLETNTKVLRLHPWKKCKISNQLFNVIKKPVTKLTACFQINHLHASSHSILNKKLSYCWGTAWLAVISLRLCVRH